MHAPRADADVHAVREVHSIRQRDTVFGHDLALGRPSSAAAGETESFAERAVQDGEFGEAGFVPLACAFSVDGTIWYLIWERNVVFGLCCNEVED